METSIKINVEFMQPEKPEFEEFPRLFPDYISGMEEYFLLTDDEICEKVNKWNSDCDVIEERNKEKQNKYNSIIEINKNKADEIAIEMRGDCFETIFYNKRQESYKIGDVYYLQRTDKENYRFEDWHNNRVDNLWYFADKSIEANIEQLHEYKKLISDSIEYLKDERYVSRYITMKRLLGQ